jgi:hypothetical protein
MNREMASVQNLEGQRERCSQQGVLRRGYEIASSLTLLAMTLCAGSYVIASESVAISTSISSKILLGVITGLPQRL